MARTNSRKAAAVKPAADRSAEEKPRKAPANRNLVDTVTRAFGMKIREKRERSGLSLRGLARSLGVSPSLLSQIERGNVKPSAETLWTTVSELGLSLDDLFTEAGVSISRDNKSAAEPKPSEDSPIQRGNARKTIKLAGGVRWERLSASPDQDVDFVLVTYEAGATSSPDGSLYRHLGKEYGYIISGRLGIAVGFETYELGPGDSIAFSSRRPHRLWTVGDKPVTAIWFVMHTNGEGRGPNIPVPDLKGNGRAAKRQTR